MYVGKFTKDLKTQLMFKSKCIKCSKHILYIMLLFLGRLVSITKCFLHRNSHICFDHYIIVKN